MPIEHLLKTSGTEVLYKSRCPKDKITYSWKSGGDGPISPVLWEVEGNLEGEWLWNLEGKCERWQRETLICMIFVSFLSLWQRSEVTRLERTKVYWLCFLSQGTGRLSNAPASLLEVEAKSCMLGKCSASVPVGYVMAFSTSIPVGCIMAFSTSIPVGCVMAFSTQCTSGLCHGFSLPVYKWVTLGLFSISIPVGYVMAF